MLKRDKLIFKKIQGKRYLWLIPLNSNHPWQDIWAKHPYNSNGLGGAYASFNLHDGTRFEVKGPYNWIHIDVNNTLVRDVGKTYEEIIADYQLLESKCD